MTDILKLNSIFWGKAYYSPNIESYIYRLYGRILKPEFGLPIANPKSKLLDFGCGQGSAVNFFSSLGFESWGVDQNPIDINIAKERYPHIADKFSIIPNNTCEIESFGSLFGVTNFDIIIACQVLYFLPKEQFNHFLLLASSSLNKNGLLFATMYSQKDKDFYQSSALVKEGDGWMREVCFESDRKKISNYFIHFVKDEEDLVEKFANFLPVHIGEYSIKLHKGDTNEHHYTFLGIKK